MKAPFHTDDEDNGQVAQSGQHSGKTSQKWTLGPRPQARDAHQQEACWVDQSSIWCGHGRNQESRFLHPKSRVYETEKEKSLSHGSEERKDLLGKDTETVRAANKD